MFTPKAGQYYYHYKHTNQTTNNYAYLIVGIAKHSETLEDMVIYKPLYKFVPDFYVRPLSMWFDPIKTSDFEGERFTLIADVGIIKELELYAHQ
jgi:hypothetical protein